MKKSVCLVVFVLLLSVVPSFAENCEEFVLDLAGVVEKERAVSRTLFVRSGMCEVECWVTTRLFLSELPFDKRLLAELSARWSRISEREILPASYIQEQILEEPRERSGAPAERIVLQILSVFPLDEFRDERKKRAVYRSLVLLKERIEQVPDGHRHEVHHIFGLVLEEAGLKSQEEKGSSTRWLSARLAEEGIGRD